MCAGANNLATKTGTMSFKIVGVGELLWDLLPAGKVRGGAPANFAYHSHALGAKGSLITRVGEDPLGRELISELQALGLPTQTVQVDGTVPTGTVTVQLLADGQPQFTINDGVAWDRIELAPAALNDVGAADAVCFGSLAQRNSVSRSTIQKLAATAPASALKIFDINLRQHYYTREIIEQSLALANILKLNDGELPIVAEMFDLSGAPEQQLQQIAQRFQLRLVAFTRGAHGSLLYSDGKWFDHPGVHATIKDTIGAGDSFTAALTLGLLRKMPLQEINQRANELAAFVCSQAGATPPLPENLRKAFARNV
jgi:fructokinase